MSELRKAIEDQVVRGVQFELVTREMVEDKLYKAIDIQINNQWIRIHLPFDAILDAVIAALPEDKTGESSEYAFGYSEAIDDVKAIIRGSKDD